VLLVAGLAGHFHAVPPLIPTTQRYVASSSLADFRRKQSVEVRMKILTQSCTILHRIGIWRGFASRTCQATGMRIRSFSCENSMNFLGAAAGKASAAAIAGPGVSELRSE
jgi:hypothetical protein